MDLRGILIPRRARASRLRRCQPRAKQRRGHGCPSPGRVPVRATAPGTPGSVEAGTAVPEPGAAPYADVAGLGTAEPPEAG